MNMENHLSDQLLLGATCKIAGPQNRSHSHNVQYEINSQILAGADRKMLEMNFEKELPCEMRKIRMLENSLTKENMNRVNVGKNKGNHKKSTLSQVDQANMKMANAKKGK